MAGQLVGIVIGGAVGIALALCVLRYGFGVDPLGAIERRNRQSTDRPPPEENRPSRKVVPGRLSPENSPKRRSLSKTPADQATREQGSARSSDEPQWSLPAIPEEPLGATADPTATSKIRYSGRYVFPSGNALELNALSLVDPDEFMEQIEKLDPANEPLVTLAYDAANSVLRAVAGCDRQNRLHGLCIEVYRHQQMMRAAYYKNGNRDGVFRAWNEAGELLFAANYINDRLDGFCCLFENNQLRLALEYEKGRMIGVHAISGKRIINSYQDPSQISDGDRQSQDLLLLLEEYQKQIKDSEDELKRNVREEARNLTESQRRELAVIRNRLMSGLIQQRENQRRLMNQGHIDSIRARSSIE
jgi:hypothetical protein